MVDLTRLLIDQLVRHYRLMAIMQLASKANSRKKKKYLHVASAGTHVIWSLLFLFLELMAIVIGLC